MLVTKETEAALAMFRSLDPDQQDALIDLLEALLRLQEMYAGSEASKP